MGPRRLLGAWVLASACTMTNPAFDQDDSINDVRATSTGIETTGEVGDEATDEGDESEGIETGAEDEIATGSESGTVEILASFVGCRGTDNYTPAECALWAGQGQANAVAIDESSDSGHFLVACLAFPKEPALEGKTITKVSLEMHTINTFWAGSDSSGEIWKVEPFTVVDFFLGVPLLAGDEPVASNSEVGPIDAPIQWELHSEVFIPDEATYLCAYPLSDDGLYLYSHEGLVPPKLHVAYQ
ncbi:hypothetical protein [Enhygromyxa salina]|uniref:hypothetical protein n=1 Tax=Enhygromyxa salina TaxID=215803 RepID=UPI000D08AA8B|nr:hypothetical protein [Enhygromyxa salina]